MTTVRDRPSYDEDFYLWTQDQAARLRQLVGLRGNEPLDWELIAEEIESLGRSDLRTAMSLVEQIMAYLLKLGFSTAGEPRDHWTAETARFRIDLERVLTAALVAKVRPDLSKRYGVARKLVELASRTHEPDLAVRLPTACPYSWEQVTGDWWPER